MRIVSTLERSSNHLGTIPGISLKLKVKKGEVHNRPYAITEKLKTSVKAEVEQLLKAGIIRKALLTEYALPAFPLIRKTSKIRLVVDCRILNKLTIKKSYLFPNVKNELQLILRSFIFSQIDLKSGYYQINIEEISRYYTAFVLLFGAIMNTCEFLLDLQMHQDYFNR